MWVRWLKSFLLIRQDATHNWLKQVLSNIIQLDWGCRCTIYTMIKRMLAWQSIAVGEIEGVPRQLRELTWFNSIDSTNYYSTVCITVVVIILIWNSEWGLHLKKIYPSSPYLLYNYQNHFSQILCLCGHFPPKFSRWNSMWLICNNFSKDKSK